MQSHSFIIRRRVLLALGGLTLARFSGAADVEEKRTGGPYVPTPQIVVDEMLRLGKVGPGDFVLTWARAGVIVLTARKSTRRGIRLDRDPQIVTSNNRRRSAGWRTVLSLAGRFKRHQQGDGGDAYLLPADGESPAQI